MSVFSCETRELIKQVDKDKPLLMILLNIAWISAHLSLVIKEFRVLLAGVDK